ncbi:hypothetical protein [Streptomyces sp. NPDC091215]|uniref:hypothetical protein n=1 Tax=Streptomyces sp. NPDC091215 TaxID=3155192 RepID=UPI00343B49A2
MNITRIPENHNREYRLGRHVRHDPRSADYALPALPKSAIKNVIWERHIPILDQGQIGSCEPNTGVELLATNAVGYTGVTSVQISKSDTQGEFAAGATWQINEDMALQLYRLLTRIDDYPGSWEPDDTGSDGLTMAKALVMLGLSDVYHHAFTYKAAVSALQKGPVAFGTVWYNSMFDPKPDGEIIVDPSSGVAGGHAYMSRQFDADNDRVWIDNHWAESWGLDGRAWVSGTGMTTLLKAQGDVIVPHLIGAAPTPTPTGPTGAQVAAAVRGALTGLGV